MCLIVMCEFGMKTVGQVKVGERLYIAAHLVATSNNCGSQQAGLRGLDAIGSGIASHAGQLLERNQGSSWQMHHAVKEL